MTSKCGSCSSTNRFEVKEHTPKDSKFKLLFVQCAGCGGVVGAMDFYNIGEKLNVAAIEIVGKVDDVMKMLKRFADLTGQAFVRVEAALRAKR